MLENNQFRQLDARIAGMEGRQYQMNRELPNSREQDFHVSQKMQNGVFEKGFDDMMKRQDAMLAKQLQGDEQFGALRDWAEDADQRLNIREREAAAAINGDFAEAAATGAARAAARSDLVGSASPLQGGKSDDSDDSDDGQPPPPPTAQAKRTRSARQVLRFDAPPVLERTTPGGSAARGVTGGFAGGRGKRRPAVSRGGGGGGGAETSAPGRAPPPLDTASGGRGRSATPPRSASRGGGP